MTFIEKFDELAEARGMTGVDAFRKAGVGESTYYRCKRLGSTPRSHNLKALAAFLKIPESTLSGKGSQHAHGLPATVAAHDASLVDASEDIVFLGLRAETIKVLQPFLERLGDLGIKVPSDCAEALMKIASAKASFNTFEFDAYAA